MIDFKYEIANIINNALLKQDNITNINKVVI